MKWRNLISSYDRLRRGKYRDLWIELWITRFGNNYEINVEMGMLHAGTSRYPVTLHSNILDESPREWLGSPCEIRFLLRIGFYRLLCRSIWKFFAPNETHRKFYVYKSACRFLLKKYICFSLQLKAIFRFLWKHIPLADIRYTLRVATVTFNSCKNHEK